MLDDKLQNYIDGLLPKSSGLFAEMEAFAKENNVPIMEPAGMEALLQMLRLHNPSAILELGTAIGYSALRMAMALPEAKVVTIERDNERYGLALEYIEKSGAKGRIHTILGDALEAAGEARMHAPFDAIFIDAAKGQYKKFFDLYAPMVRPGGIIVTDNVLFKGLVYEQASDNKRLAKLAAKINGYNEWLARNEEYYTVILPIGDGVAISYKKG